MATEMRKISVQVIPPNGEREEIFLKTMQSVTEQVISTGNYQKFVQSDQITLSWYDDFPASEAVVLTISFSIMEAIDLIMDLIVAFRKKGYEAIGVTIGY